MNFFEQQDRSRRATRILLGLFTAAVIFTGICVYFGVMLTVVAKLQGRGNFSLWDVRIFCATVIFTAIVMGGVSWSKISQLQAGGAIIAADLGGTRVFPEIATAEEQQLLNIVEEMAISATMAVPPVYILQHELGINSFAAGHTTNNAVIGVTRGCLDKLTRAELQGVIAHEFSHILNGDMAMNIRLTGMLQGILSLQLAGRILSCTGSNSNNPLQTLGVLLRVIGCSGFVSGRLIQSAICQQRELLADASAVQFTRNADAIASAMTKIDDFGSFLSSPYAETNNHMFFAPAIEFKFRFLDHMFSAHPPFSQRTKIVRGTGKQLGTKIVVNGQIVPTFNPIISIEQIDGTHTLGTGDAPTTATPVGEYATLAHLYALLLDSDLAHEQLDYLTQVEEPAVIEQIEQIRSTIAIIPPQQRLATLDRQIVNIRNTAHAPRLLKCAHQMINLLPPEDWHTALVYLILHHRLAPTVGTPPEIYQSIQDVWAEIINIVGTFARSSSSKPQDIEYNFEMGLMRLPSSYSKQAKLPPELTWREFQTDLSKIAVAAPKVKQALIAACLEILNNQRQVPQTGADLMRSIAILLDCPIPARLDKSPVLQH